MKIPLSALRVGEIFCFHSDSYYYIVTKNGKKYVHYICLDLGKKYKSNREHLVSIVELKFTLKRNVSRPHKQNNKTVFPAPGKENLLSP